MSELGIKVSAKNGKVHICMGDTTCAIRDLDGARKLAERIYEEIGQAEKQTPIEAEKVSE